MTLFNFDELPDDPIPGESGHRNAHSIIHRYIKSVPSEINSKETKVSINVSDYATFEDAITEVNKNSDGVILRISPGLHIVKPVRITASNVTIEAAGSELKLANGSNTHLLSIAPDAMNFNYMGGRLNGNKAGQTAGPSHCIYFEPYEGVFRVSDRSNFDRTEILNAYTDGLHLGSKRIGIVARRCQVRDATRYGVYFGSTDCTFRDGGLGISDICAYIDGHANWLIGNGIYSGKTAGVRLTENSRYTFVTENMIDHNDKIGLQIEGATASTMDAIIANNQFRANTRLGEGLNPDIKIANARAVLFTGNVSVVQSGYPKTSWAIEFGVGVSDIFDGGNNFDKIAHVNGVFSDPLKISDRHSRLDVITAASADSGYTSKVVGDTQDRFRIGSGGLLQWGSGTATTDVTLYRPSTNVLRTGQQFEAQRVTAQGLGGAGYLACELSQAVAAPTPADGFRLYARKNASSKVEICVKFPSGDIQVLSTEV